MRGGSILLGFGLVWSAMVCGLDYVTLVPVARQALSSQYPSVDGVILSSEVTEHEGDDGPTFGVKFSYSYSVNGREYVGRRYRYQSGSSSDDAWAHRATADNPPGSEVKVYYNPRFPDDSLLSPGVSGGDLYLLMFVTPFNAVMLGFWWAGIAHVRRVWFKPVAGGVRIVKDLRQTRVRLAPYPPLGVVLGVITLSAFVSIFVVGFFAGGFHPALRTMVVTWIIILAAGAIFGAWYWAQVLSGRYDLIIDELGGAFELPRTYGRKTPRRVPFSNIAGIFVEMIQKPTSEGAKTSSYAPTLRLADGKDTKERLVEWYTFDKAQAFVEWLNRQLWREPILARDR